MSGRSRPRLDTWLERSGAVLDEGDERLHLDNVFVTLRRQPGLELQVRRGTLLDEEMVEIAQWNPADEEHVGSVLIRMRDLQPLIAELRRLGRFTGHGTDRFWYR